MKTQGFFLLRRPLLSKEILFGFQKAVADRPDLFEYYLKIIYSDARLQQAVHLASPELYDQLLRLISGELQNGKEKILQTLYKYLIRMCTRCTPFGLFAGCAVGTLTGQNKIKFQNRDFIDLYTRLDSECLLETCKQILQNDAVLNQSKFFPNTSLYRALDSYRYFERLSDSASGFQLSAVQSTQILDLVLASAKDGLQYEELIGLLLRENVPLKQATEFTSSLLKAGVLVSSLEMNATGEDYLTRMISALEDAGGAQSEIARFSKIDMLLKTGSNPVSVYENLHPLLNFENSANHSRHLIQSNLYFNTDVCEISQVTVDVIESDIKQLIPLAQQADSPDLKQFASKLFERLGSRQMLLLTCLDEISGIGFGSLNPAGANELPILEGLGNEIKSESEKKGDSALSTIKIKILQRAKNQGLKTVELTVDDLKENSEVKSGKLPVSFYLLGSILAESESAASQGDFKFDLRAMAGPSCLSLMTRFTQASPDLESKLRSFSAYEQSRNPGVIFAEICHIPDARSLNVIKRPSLYDYEIPYLSASCVEPGFQIQPGEICVSSPDGKQIILTCQRLGKRIIPRLSSAHNYSNGLPFYRFLCELAQQSGASYLNWDWHQSLDEPFFPRITFKHLILQKASWQLDGKLHERLTGNRDQVLSAWSSICQQFQIPRYVQIQQGDNQLLIDGQCVFSLQLLCSYLKKSKKLTLVEYLDPTGQGFLAEDGKSIEHEIIIPFLTGESREETEVIQHCSNQEPVIYNPGSEWLYLKIYCSAQASDYLLTNIIAPFCESLLGQGTIEKWFYIRYYDPEEHLRVRFNLADKLREWSSLLSQFHSLLSPFLNIGLIWALKTDYYQREISRYPFLPYSKLESIFYTDSQCTSNCLRLLTENADPYLKWLLALRGCDQLLNDLGLNGTGKLAVIQDLHAQFTKEFSKDYKDLITLDKKYRKYRTLIHSYLDPGFDHQNSILEFTCLFTQRSGSMKQALESVDSLPQEQIKELAMNLVHLFLNRWFNTQQRRQEWVLYHFLQKYYKTVLKLIEHDKISSS
ncbi:lantibiotic dehydratase [Dyadobacter sp. CY345]|uniref:lantibiotic dehydratase n=1 Tax=Dyadobacter sp. CY345 TaxID=2909335 RepID=UPI001F346EEA|nr:lantibiotic dehydratase [Dyadobacter sp. CY345]MCF2443299.1 lantibiotic dehydratase [Dyadobacter sp. CY345]